MIFFNMNESPVAKLIKDRASLIVATRDLLYADALLMEDMGNNGCDYCSGGDDDVPDGHDLYCNFATAFEVILQERAVGYDAIKEEALAIRDALVMLVADDFALMGVNVPCWYCGVDDEHHHEDDCELQAAIRTLQAIPRESLL